MISINFILVDLMLFILYVSLSSLYDKGAYIMSDS